MKQKQLLDMLMEKYCLSIYDIFLSDNDVIGMFYVNPIISTYGISECSTPYWIETINGVHPHDIIDLAKLIVQSRSSGTYYIYPYDKAMDLALLSYRLAWFKYYHRDTFYDTFLKIYGNGWNIKGLLNTSHDKLGRDINAYNCILDNMDPTEFNTFDDYEECRLTFIDIKLLYEVIQEMKINKIL